MRQDLKNAIKLIKEYCHAVDEENKIDWMTCRGCVIQTSAREVCVQGMHLVIGRDDICYTEFCL